MKLFKSIKFKSSIKIKIISSFLVLSFITAGYYSIVSIVNYDKITNNMRNYLNAKEKGLNNTSETSKSVTIETIKNANKQLNNNFTFLFTQIDSVVETVVHSDKAVLLYNHSRLPQIGNINQGEHYDWLPKANRYQMDDVLLPYLGDIQSNTKGIAYAYFATPDNAMYSMPNDSDLSGVDWTKRDWYKNAISNPGKVVWSNAYVDAGTGQLVVTASKAINDYGQLSGVFATDVSLDTLRDLANNTKIGKTGFFFLLDKDGNLLTYPNEKKNLGKNLLTPEKSKPVDRPSKDFSKNLPFIKDVYKKDNDVLDVNVEGKEKVVIYTTNEITGWKLVFTADKNDLFGITKQINQMKKDNKAQIINLDNISTSTKINFIITGIILILLGTLFGYLLSKNILNRIQGLKRLTESVSNGDLTQIVETKSNDEIDALAIHFNEMSGKLRELVQTNIKIASQIDDSADNLAAVSEEATAQTTEISFNIEEIADAASKQAEDINEASYVVDEFNSSIKNMSLNAGVVNDSVTHTVEVSKQGSNVVESLQNSSEKNLEVTKQVANNINELNKEMERIVSFTASIKGIAEQTNLLALNASIEAARAGEHGKGFAVVADEVRKLAEEASKSAGEIDSVISIIRNQVQLSVGNMNEAENTVKQQHEMVRETKTAFATIEEAITNIAKQMNDMDKTMKGLDVSRENFSTTIRNISATTEETAVSAKNVVEASKEQIQAINHLTGSAQSLKEMTIDLNEQIKKFKI